MGWGDGKVRCGLRSLYNGRMDHHTRFWSKVRKTRGCWHWTAGKNAYGYGVYYHEGRMKLAHRVAYEGAFGPIDKGLHVDHLCRVTDCVKPEHLDAVTQAENNRRQGAAITHCPQGHKYTEENTRWRRHSRECKRCHNARVCASRAWKLENGWVRVRAGGQDRLVKGGAS